MPEPGATQAVIQSDTQSRVGDRIVLDGHVSITYGEYSAEADHVEYNDATGDAEATGHVYVTANHRTESFHASHATLNVRTETGRFYDVNGSVGVRQTARGAIYTNGNPFLFTGRIVIKTGPQELEILDGTVTSCALPKPDWQLAAGRFTVKDGKAAAKNSVFRLLNIPVIFLPYVTHPVEADERQSGFMIPEFTMYTGTKGFSVGEKIYFAINRSTDLLVGAEYFSRRGWQQSANFKYRGRGLDFISARYIGLLDRGFYQQQTTTSATGVTTTANVYVNQGGEDATLGGRRDLSDHARVAASAEYLSSFTYREAFTNTFNEAVTSDITSYVYGTYARNGYVGSAEAERYQGLKVASTGDQIRIFHAPTFQLESMERRVGTTPVLWSLSTQLAELKRTQGTPAAQTGFATNFTTRLDVHPQLSMPFALGGFRFRPSVGLHDTYYSHSKVSSPLPGPPPQEVNASLNRVVTEAEMEVRLPVLERTFDTGVFQRFLGRDARHTIEPELHYRYATGVDSFSETLRFDATDVVSNKNELEYGFTQRLFLRPTKLRDCEAGEDPTEADAACGGTRETLRWKLMQRHYFDEGFGGVIVNGRRNVLDSTLDFSGVAFLTDPRSNSPILSQIKLSATDHMDVEWDINYDTHAGKFTQSNTFVDFHEGNYFAGLSHARLNAPGRFGTTTGSGTTVSSATSDFSQMRVLLGYGAPTKPGLSLAANAGIDLKLAQIQYGTAQLSYNWNCCGFSFEYRKFDLGNVRNESGYHFNFTLANIGTAGNLRKAERLF